MNTVVEFLKVTGFVFILVLGVLGFEDVCRWVDGTYGDPVAEIVE